MLQNILSYTGTPDSLELHCQDENNIPYTLKFKTGKLEVLLSSEELPIYAKNNGEEQCVWFRNKEEFYIKIPILIQDDATCTIKQITYGDKNNGAKSKYIR